MNSSDRLRRLRSALAIRLANRRFTQSADYWEQRYRSGGTSGDGSYGALAEYKATILNTYVAEHDVDSVIELGSGDGHQLTLAKYPRYLGLDVSASSVRQCMSRFAEDETKSFIAYDPSAFSDPASFLGGDLALSLDVIYHLVEDEVFERYMRLLFATAQRAVIIYSSNTAENSQIAAKHVRNRCFTDWVEVNAPEWELVTHMENPYASDVGGDGLSIAAFFVFELRDAAAG